MNYYQEYSTAEGSYDLGLRKHLLSVFNNMALGLVVSGLVAGFIGTNPVLLAMIFGGPQMWLFITAATFGTMSLYGYTTKRDLSKMGSFLMMGLIGLVIAGLVNMFLQSSALQLAISACSVLIFVGLTAYDMQQIKEIYYATEGDDREKMGIVGALNLYMDFINIFINLLQLIGDKKD